ncbi:hypothetical protein TcG_03793 [Trypanosoma cruzi]|nr:hypothetical protein TcG_03793 [Trypanosoma cruzi]
MAIPNPRRWRREFGGTRKRRIRIVLRFLFFSLCLLVIGVFLLLLLAANEKRTFEKELTEREIPHYSTNEFFTRVSFVMSSAMATAWRTSSDRLEFPAEMWVERVAVRPSAATTVSLPAVLQKATVSATLYGKSSLKLQRTKRRSLYIRSDSPIFFVTPNPALSPNPFKRNTTVALKEFILLSLWEDIHRIAYRTSVDLLQHLDLIFSYAQLVELRCYPPSQKSHLDHPCVPSVAGVSVRDGVHVGRTLGVYLAIEPPAPAIWRRMKEAFSAFEELANESLREVIESVSHGFPAALQKREYESVMEHTARITYWRQMWRAAKKSSPGKLEHSVEIGSRNFLSFSEPRHDMSHVPSFLKNSSLLPSYRLLERDPWHYGLHSETAVGKTVNPKKQFLDLPQYMAWIAINTILQNGDYDDEVFFYGVLKPIQYGNSNFQSPIYLGVMGWDYDTVFSPCHRKVWFKASVMYCAETTLDKSIYDSEAFIYRYTDMLWDMTQHIDRERFSRSVQVAENELQTILYGAPGTTMATFNQVKREYDAGVRWIIGAFLEQRQILLRALASYFPVNEVSHCDQTSDRDAKALEIHNREAHLELMKRLSIVVKVKGSRVSTRWGFLVGGIQSALGVDLPEDEEYQLPDAGIYCARVSAVASFFTSAGLLPPPKGRGKWEAPGFWFVDMPLVEPSTSRGSAEFGLWSFDKKLPMLYPMTTPDAGATLSIVIPPVWPQDSKEKRGVFVSRVLFPEQGSENSLFRWSRKNTLIFTLDAPTQKTMIVRGFSAVRFFVPEKSEDDSFSAQRHEEENTVRGPGLFASNSSTTRLHISDVEIEQSVPLASVAAPPQAPSLADGLVDAKGVKFGGSLEKQTMLRCIPENASVAESVVEEGLTLRSAECPIFISGSFEISRGATLDVAAGCVVVMRPAAMLRVTGFLWLNGTVASPIVVTSESAESASSWRTIHVDGPTATLYASFTFFTGSGVKGIRVANTGKHHSHSAAISATNKASVYLRHSFLLELQGAGIAAGNEAEVQVEDSLVQWAQMGIECVQCTFTSRRSVWTHFPSWDAAYADNDNDAMYLSGGKHRVIDSVIAHTKDDGIDSGATGNGGSLVVHNTIVEGCMHEGVALSSDPNGHREVVISHTIVQYCQQGIESGYASKQHTASITSSLIQKCSVGVRYGDNYHWSHCDGKLTLQNTTLAQNEVNVMNYERRYQVPQDPEYFHSEGVLSQRHWKLLQDAARDSALPLAAAPPEAVVMLLMDVRRRELPKTGWEGCKDMFLLPGNNTLIVDEVVDAEAFTEELRVTEDVTVTF